MPYHFSSIIELKQHAESEAISGMAPRLLRISTTAVG